METPAAAPDAGELREHIRVMECAPVPGEDAFAWREVRKAWAKAESTGRLAIFANTGVGSRETVFTLRRQRFTLKNAILWRGGFYLPTAVSPLGLGHLSVKTAQAEPGECRGEERDTGRTIRFPGVAVEKFMGHEQAEPMAENAVGLVLVVPKLIRLALGSLVLLPDGAEYWVKVLHELDPDKTELELERTVEP